VLLGIRWGSLRTKIVAWSFVPTAIILAAVALVTYAAYQRVTEDLVVEHDRELTRLFADQLATELSVYTDLLVAEARAASIRQNDPAAQRSALERAGERLAVFDGGVLILDDRGAVVAAEPERTEALGQDWSDRPYFRQMLDTPTPVFSDIVADGPGGTKVIVVAVPITGPHNEFVGTIAGMLRVGATTVRASYGDIVELCAGESGSAYLVDGNGRAIYYTDPGRIADDLSAQEIVQQVLNGQTGAVRTHDFADQDIVASFAPVPGTSWGLVAQESWAVLSGASRDYSRFLLLLLALGVVGPALAVAFGVNRLTKPIADLINAAQKVAEGDFVQTISACTGDEIEELADQFNRMSARLRESYASLEQRVADRTKELAALNAIVAVVSQSLGLDEVLNRALDKTLQVMDVEAGGIYLLDEEVGVLTIAAYQGFDAEFAAEIDRLKVGEGFSGRVAQSGQPLVVRNVSADPRLTRMIVREKELRSLASVPLSSRGKVLGTLFALTRGYREFTDQDVELLTSIGHQIGVAVDSARLLQAEQRRAEQFRVIAEVGRRITSILDIDEVLVQVVRLIRKAFGYGHVGIALIEGDYVVYKVGAGVLWDDPQFQFEPARLKVSKEGLTGWVAATGEPLLVPDVSQEPRYVWMRGSKTRSELVVPITFKGRIIGVLDVQSDCLNAFDESDLAVLQSLANQAAIAIENAQLFEAEQRRAEQFRVISEVGHRVTSILSIDELLNQMAGLIREAFNYYHVGFGLVEGDEVVSKAEVGASADACADVCLKVGQEGVWGWVAHSGEPLLVPDVSQEPRFQFMPQATEIRSQVCVPLKTKEAVIGVLSAESNQLNAFDESDLAVLQSLAQQAAIAIENARLFRDTARQVRELRALADASRIISFVLDQNQLLEALYEQIARVAPADFYLIALYDAATNVVSIEINVDKGVHYPKEQYVLDEGLLKRIIHDRQVLRFDSLAEERHRLDVEIMPTGSLKINHGWLGVPMLYGDKVLGAVVVGSYQRAAFDEGHQQILTSIANQAAVALENARLYGQAQQLAVMEERGRLARELHDAVTQTLFSASLIAEALPDLWEGDQEEGRQLLGELRQLSRGALAEMRTLLMELRPAALVEANLSDLLRQLGEAVTGRTGVPVIVSVEDVCALPTDVHVAFYRIVQETLNNAVKHANASQVTVSLRCLSLPPRPFQVESPGEGVELSICDDGRGFDPRNILPDRLGLGIIRERAQAIGATLQIESQPGRGTQVTVVWKEEE
jgi:GAF domain-containing protein/HAMP domain-containing protein/anti-sigma regulatory factor (Ser/Thr protein kinase)